ncbi:MULTISPECIES: chemotaxis protein CheW [Geobacter]|uniref:Chemotaxis protein CheW n=2 Tax=Geobacter TaxID=28231 RepID=A0A0C1QTL3_9BACT|nr:MULTISPECIES: chemotaxis protein CheW [Geobacter]ANA39776.1 chemotaxis protein CheW [Geobacter anodireducens]KIE41576.1 chemotaxis protein CheW [Geobacter soli]MBE2887522.1 chemotaxis protein CheW [Geobacter anodireducens]HMN01879.1 chemotaxis protein CheW [Geobacter anodireducens]
MAHALATNISTGSRDELIQLVSFTVDREEYGVDVLKVREIIRMSSITQVPEAPPYVDGIINLRGRVIPIISLRDKFGLADAESDNRTRIVVMGVGDALLGFRVDAVSEVIRIAGSRIQPSPALLSSGGEQEYIVGVIDQGEKLLVMLDPEKMLTPRELGQLGDTSRLC